MSGPVLGGGLPIVRLQADPIAGRHSIVEASVLPGRGLMLLQARLALPDGEIVDLLHAPPPAEAAAALDGGPEDFAGNAAFAFGGAILAPFANRIRGRALPDAREIETVVDGETVRLPRNWGGRRPGAETYAMHGLILAAPVPHSQPSRERVTGRLAADAFGGRWPGAAELGFEWRLQDGGLRLDVEAVNRGPGPLPVGIGWHPYFRVLGGRREAVRLKLPASQRTEVNDYDEVLPTGRLLEVAGTPYDFSGEGRALGDIYLDDCFTGLAAQDGRVTVEMRDPAAGVALSVVATAPPVRAVQVYAPPDKAFVVIEPQFNLADPYGAQWPAGLDTGMVRTPPGGRVRYQAELRISAA